MQKRRKKYSTIDRKLILYILAGFAVVILCIHEGIISVPGIDYLTSFLGLDGRVVVCIDSGHGGYDTGCQSYDGTLEKDITLKLGLKLGEILEKNNIKVIYTRKDDQTVLGANEREDLRKRVDISNGNNADILVSLHCNKCSRPSVKGIELWCYEPNSKSEELAEDIRSELYKVNYTTERPMKYNSDSSLYVLRNSKAIAALVEVGYLSNWQDKKYISSEEGQSKCADAIAKAVLEFARSLK